MTVIERWDEVDNAAVFRANDCVEARVGYFEVRDADDFAEMAGARCVGLIAHAMPVHDSPALTEQQRSPE